MMNGASDKLFARAGFTKNEYGGIGGSDLLDSKQYLFKDLAFSDDVSIVMHQLDLFFKIGTIRFELTF